ncbi:IS30 family transposase [Arthrobacter mangrovi]|uniref:Transposase InsI for insertion sequence element IS30A n=1 Tax=Arthrobacter mangrovi TaxID=2966350 RepID=A0ABQ5N070_9MICC|nr:IS30 family transposase [Arthrobacter mangrovi]GLB69589.1 transposase InsI for insertion sequence element IS30A [Arthrobacter mangrovi]
MPRYAPNKMPTEVKRRYFELIREGLSGSAAAARVGVSLSCGSLWFIDAGSVDFIDRPISPRYLTQDDRIEIADGLAAGEPVKVIAARIGKSYQSVYRELARNRRPDGRYQPWFAHGQAHQRRRRPRERRFAFDEALRNAVVQKLDKHWSPAQIKRWLRRRWPKRKCWHVCTETIYEAVYRGLITARDSRTLRTGRTYRRRRGRGRNREGAMKQSTNMRPISQRPAVVESRTRIGHWEGDLIIGSGQRSAIATLVERKSRLTILVPIRQGRTAQNVGDALIHAFTALPTALRGTLTWDQGNEMFHHERIERATGIRIYFADPHSPWQRGTNENTNGLLRQYFPKGTDLGLVTDERLREVTIELNDRPRACLNDRTPLQVMARWKRHLATS